MKKISIIVPVYNVESYLDECITSLIEQTYTNIEIILVNDGSTDKSGIICDKYVQKDKRIKVIHKDNTGQANCRNIGIRKSKGDYLFFVDSDDFIEKTTLDNLYQQTQNGTIDLVLCDYYKYYNSNDKVHIPLIPFYNKNNLKCHVISMPTPGCKLIRKKMFDIDFLENTCYEDNAIMPYVVSKIENWRYLNKPLYYYRQREGSTLNKSHYDKKWEDIFDVLEYLKGLFKDSGTYNEFKEELEYIYIEYLLHAASLKFYKYDEGKYNIKRIKKIMKTNFPKWRKNKYYKKENIKYKIICNLFYYNQLNLIKLILR